MSDNQQPDSAQEQQVPYDRLIFDRTDERLPVIKEDYDVDNEAFSHQLGTAISGRTGKPIPKYLTKVFYKTSYLDRIVDAKSERVCERRYPADDLRTMPQLYKEAEKCFSEWWSHLDDDQSAKVDKAEEEKIKQRYIIEFMQRFTIRLDSLDYKHPEHLEELHKWRDKGHAYTKRFEDPDIGSRYYFKDYTSRDPRWKQNIAAQGRDGGRIAAEEDIEIGVGFRKGEELEQLASERFEKFWFDLVFEIYFEQQGMFDYVGLRTIYTINFMRSCAERAAGGQSSVGTDEVGARIVSTHLEGDSRVYLIEISDSEHLDEPAQVEVSIQAKGAPE